MADSSLRVAILGASGYGGAELIRILAHHPNAEIVVLTGDRRAGKPLGEVFPHLAALNMPDLIAIEQVEWAGLDIDVVFSALPHGASQRLAKGLLHRTGHGLAAELVAEGEEDLVAALPRAVKVIDLAADFRLADPAVYRQWYGHDHEAVELQPRAVYGLTEFARDQIRTANLIACPGCYPTSAILPLVPLLEDAAILPTEIIIDAKSGVSGAGRAEKEANLFCEVSEGIHPYGIASHRHAPEIEQALSKSANEPVTVTFTPHLVPMNRGILSTIYVRLAEGATAADVRQVLVDRFVDEPFVSVLDGKQVPATRMVRGTNRCAINVFADRVPGRAIVVSAIDNLVKGAAGQAVQNFNVAFGFPEAEGLDLEPLFP